MAAPAKARTTPGRKTSIDVIARSRGGEEGQRVTQLFAHVQHPRRHQANPRDVIADQE